MRPNWSRGRNRWTVPVTSVSTMRLPRKINAICLPSSPTGGAFRVSANPTDPPVNARRPSDRPPGVSRFGPRRQASAGVGRAHGSSLFRERASRVRSELASSLISCSTRYKSLNRAGGAEGDSGYRESRKRRKRPARSRAAGFLRRRPARPMAGPRPRCGRSRGSPRGLPRNPIKPPPRCGLTSPRSLPPEQLALCLHLRVGRQVVDPA